MADERYMKLAVELARKGEGRTSPNPMVGAVIVRDGRIIGQGYHERYGELHAERAALKACTESPEGAEMYVTLEPCCHYGAQPPCTDAIIEAGIKHVIVGSSDPNELVGGKGIRILRDSDISVTEGFMKEECDALNPVFFHFITTGTPYVVLKYAMTADGKTAAYTGESKWITGEAARENVHGDRNRYTAIMTGIGTVMRDDPLLTCRIEGGRDPIRIICDTRLRISPDSKIVRTADKVRTVIACSVDEDGRGRALGSAGCEIVTVPEKDGHIDLRALMTKLGEMKIDSILLEGGGTLNWSALRAGIVNKVQAYIAPKILGGAEAPSPVGGAGFAKPDDAVALSKPVIRVIGDDVLLESEVTGCLPE